MHVRAVWALKSDKEMLKATDLRPEPRAERFWTLAWQLEWSAHASISGPPLTVHFCTNLVRTLSSGPTTSPGGFRQGTVVVVEQFGEKHDVARRHPGR